MKEGKGEAEEEIRYRRVGEEELRRKYKNGGEMKEV